MTNFVLEVLLKSTLLIAVIAVSTFALRRSTASLRHTMWSFVLAAMLAIPGLMLVLPSWKVGFLPTRDVQEPVAMGTYEAPFSLVTDGRDLGPLEPLGPMPVLNTPAVAPPSTRSLTDTLVLLWIGGVAAGLITLCGGLLTLRRIARRAEPLDSDEWNSLSTEVTAKLGIDREVRLLRSASSAMPATWGSRNPVVLLPSDADTWDDDRRRVVLLHELAHVKRNDSLTQIFAQVCCAVYWFHPGAWYVARRIRAERELACDEHVLGAGVNACDYAAHLLEIARVCRAPRATAIAAVAMARPSQLEGRLLAILSSSVGNRWRTSEKIRRSTAAGLAILTLPLAAMTPWRDVAPAKEDVFNWKGRVPAGQWVEVVTAYGEIRAELASGKDVEIKAVRKLGDVSSYKVAIEQTRTGTTFCVVSSRAMGEKLCSAKQKNANLNAPSNVRVDFLVKLPSGVGISAHTGSGNIAAEGVESYVWGTTRDGDISIVTTDLAEASTTNGSISAQFGRRTWKQNLEFLTENGDVTVVAPSDAKMMFEAWTESGRLTSEFQGNVKPFKSGQRVYSSANGGGGMLTIQAHSGVVELKRGGKAVAEVSDIAVQTSSAPHSSVDPKPNPNPNPEYNPNPDPGDDPNPNPNPAYDPDPNINPHVEDDATDERVAVSIPKGLVGRLSDGAISEWKDAAQIARLRNIAAYHVKQHGADLVQERAAWALTLIRNGEIVPALIDALRSPDWKVRAYASWALGETRDARGESAQIAALSDSHWRVRMHAASALQRTGSSSAVEPLINTLGDSYWQVRISAVDALGAIGDARAAARLEQLAARDAHDYVREEARNARQRINK